MKPVKTKSVNAIYAENQPEYIPLPVHKTIDGVVTSFWQLTFKERVKVLFGKKVCIKVLTFNQLLQPIKPFIE